MFCLPKELIDKFKEGLKSNKINPEKLTEMTSEERHSFLAEYVGAENAKSVNALFESKLLLKNQQQGIINWAQKVAGLKPEIERDIVARVNRMTQVLQPKELKSFLSDLAEQKLGFNVTMEEAARIVELAKKTAEAKAKLAAGGDRMAYGRARVEFANYTNDLRNAIPKTRTVGGTISEVAGTAKALKASMDNSAIFRQGWKTLFTNPGLWYKNAIDSFSNIAKTLGDKRVLDEVNADIVSRPNYEMMKKAKLAVGTIEEDFPTTLPEKIPGLGKLYKASEVAYTAFVHKLRADVFDKYVEIAKRTGVDLTDQKQVQSLGNFVNSLTGRGNIGRAEPAAEFLNNIFFSPRKLKADFDFLTAHQLQKGVTPFVRKQAAMNLVKVVVGTATILAIADTVAPGSVEKDPRSSDFGKIRIGDTRFDVTGGMGSLLVLAARLLTQSSKSSTTHKVTKLNSNKFGAQTGWDVIINFASNKLSPAASVVKDLVNQKDFQGNKITVGGEVANLLAPLPIQNAFESYKNPKSANLFLTTLADALGISTNTYSKKK